MARLETVKIDLGMGMAKLRGFLALTLFALLMTSARVEAQSGAAPDDVTPSDVTPSDVTPSDGLSPGPEAQEDQSRVASGARRAGTKSSMNASAETQRFCFLPGIGWQSVAVPLVDESKMKQFTSSSVGGSVSSRRAGGEQASDHGCPGFANAAASGAFRGSHAQPTSSIGLKAVNTGMNNGIIANPAINHANGSSNALGGSSTLAGYSTKSASTIASRRSMPTASASILGAERNGLKYKAYGSTFELRRMIWNAPDLETRLKLRRALEKSQRRLSTDRSEALNSTSRKFSLRSNSEASRSRVGRKTGGARRSRSTDDR